MKFDVRRILLLKPFDQSEEDKIDNYSGKFRNFLMILSFIFSVSAVSAIFAFPDSDLPLILISLGCATNAILSGADWHSGFKAKALNKLFEAIFMLVIILFLKALTQ
ncbi:hypothetical protein ACQWTT_001338 [Acinetobacter baumannii]